MQERPNLVSLRKQLHESPELSSVEKATSDFVLAFLEQCNPDSLVRDIGFYGIACVFDSTIEGPTTMFRADMDALPIQEKNDFAHRSKNNGIAHLCGHDGHTSILLGLAHRLSIDKPKSGKIILFFQSAEETGQGAKKALEHPFFNNLEIDFVFALHNLPGFIEAGIILRDGAFASASVGISINLKGKETHAAHPENGTNPGIAVAELIKMFDRLSDSYPDPGTFITLVQVDLGTIAYGTSAGSAIVRATLRSHNNVDFQQLLKDLKRKAQNIALEQSLACEIDLHEEFLAVENNAECNQAIRRAAETLEMEIVEPEQPFRWSEDFSWFTKKYNGCLFGIGAGLDHPQLHNPNYDFPDPIIEPSVELLFQAMIEVQRIFKHEEKTSIHP